MRIIVMGSYTLTIDPLTSGSTTVTGTSAFGTNVALQGSFTENSVTTATSVTSLPSSSGH